MAGGWDGDALAERFEEAQERREQAAEERARRVSSTPEEREQAAREESLRLSRARITEQLGRATNPAHREMLERALRALDAEG